MPIAALEVTGAALVQDARVEVSCDDLEEELPAVRCSVSTHFELLAVEAIEIQDARTVSRRGNRLRRAVGGGPEDHVRVDGDALAAARAVAAGQVVRVELLTTRVLRARADSTGGGWFWPAMGLRHILFGGGPEPHLAGMGPGGRLVEGDAVRIQGRVSASVRAPDFVRVHVAGVALDAVSEIDVRHMDVSVGLDLPWHPPALLQPGGPLLALGARFRLDQTDGDPRFVLRVGYELGFARHFFASATVESDFDSLLESVVVEAALPMLFVLPGPAAGIGVVARQFGGRRADAGLRLRVGMHVPILGVTADFDYWPSQQEWTGTLVARFSL